MAEHSHPPMDYDAHQRTYAGFIQLTVLTVAFCIAVVIMLAIGNAGAWGLAGLGVFLAVIGTAVGVMMKGSPWPIAIGTLVVLALFVLFG
ncbi:aa3-type cytochrome c oxidase subunit IV [Microbaculum marinum]|uniref:Aa3-type cytochrome c oxidase subunit IV n=1 Tax=Microbaculum marinum TaxID=1764581 RepID=A0AAW9S1U2_9HYPH